MAWTYSGNPDIHLKDAVRFYLGDTDPDDPQLQDEEILYLLKKHGNDVLYAAADAARSLAGRYSRKADKQVGDLRLSLGQQAQHYFDLANRFEIEASKRAVPYAGAITKSDKKKQVLDTELIKPVFKRNMMSNPSRLFDSYGKRRCY